MDKSKIDRSMYQKAKVEASEKEHIAAPASTMLADAWIRLKKNKAAVVALFILIGIILLAIFAPIFSKYSFRDTDYNNVYGFPSAAHIFGADQFGRDLWVRTWMGTRISLMIALVAAILDLVVGVLYGAVSALFGGKVDAVMQRCAEILNSIPNHVIVTLMILVLEPGLGAIIVALMITGWIPMSRIARAQMLKLKEQEFVLASKTLGAGPFRVIFKEIMPNIIGQIITQTMFSIPHAIFTEAFLAFVGLGIPAPMASLGTLISDSYKSFTTHPYMILSPLIVLALLMLSFNLVADGLRDALDPKQKDM